MINPVFSNKNEKFNIIILAAGKGTRLKPATDYIAKPLVKIGDERAIDYLIKKYQYVAHKIIIAVGYEKDLLENYVKGKYSSLNIEFSEENPEELSGPGQSLVYALDHADSKYPTIITFCDYIVNDVFTVDDNNLFLCSDVKKSVLGKYRTYIESESGVAIKLCEIKNNRVKDGFTGLSVLHDTILLKAITYLSASKGLSISYEDIIQRYISTIKTYVVKLEEIYDFGDARTLEKTRCKLNGYIE